MSNSTTSHGSTLSKYTASSSVFVDSVPVLEDECKRRGITNLPSLDQIISMVDRTLLLDDYNNQDPLSNWRPVSKTGQPLFRPIKHHWHHCGTRYGALGDREARIDLFAVDVKTRGSDTGDARDAHTLRAIFSQRARGVDDGSEETPRPSLSIDNYPIHNHYTIIDQRDPTGGHPRPYASNFYVVGIPQSMYTDMEEKIKEGGEAVFDEDFAQCMIQGVDSMLGLYFEGSGEVGIPEPWEIPRIVKHTETSRDNASVLETYEDNECDDIARQILGNQDAADFRQELDQALIPGLGSVPSGKSSTRSARMARRRTKGKEPSQSNRLDAGSSR